MEIGRFLIVLSLVGIPMLIFWLAKNKKQTVDKLAVLSGQQAKELEGYIIYVASAFENENFFLRAKEISDKLEFTDAEKLTLYFHKNLPVPDGLKDTLSKYGLFGVWMDICQNAIFEILYNYKNESIPLLHKLSFGQYDWTQYKALGVLLRFVREGVTDDSILDKLLSDIEDFRYEAIMNILDSLSEIKNSPKANGLFRAIYDLYNDDLADSISILEMWSKEYPDAVLKEKSKIIDILTNPEKLNKSGYTTETGELLKVKGNILFYKLDKNDGELKRNLEILKETVTDVNLKGKISLALKH